MQVGQRYFIRGWEDVGFQLDFDLGKHTLRRS